MQRSHVIAMRVSDNELKNLNVMAWETQKTVPEIMRDAIRMLSTRYDQLESQLNSKV
ncbi:ribbon-helix-helix protein, CopG family [Geobacter sp. AOG2]|uniref:ribbon-helix-helix protein, CopG family n=1 Tax=Geobacter sp. AOG2 TaxID=1566347 RepID=UPI001CC60EFB|nr:ribbon-helix-helix protein, CopG family [Geobacter sp. AOG2]GFE62642.1 hypothetical protein AOG2_32300 [Geobacter sp. AOG2]